ncbi:MAG TPA: hypothetical protein VFA56_08900 [Gaiellaceae bacterium]|nr:hypothetical protein [Gaiellaceae bacterium]
MRLAALVCVAGFGLGLAAAASAAQPRPLLALHGTSPVHLRGAGFAAHERVTLTANGPKLWRRVVVADRHGTFALELPRVFALGRCSSFTVSAVGASGRRAVEGMGSTTGCSKSGMPTPTDPGADS